MEEGEMNARERGVIYIMSVISGSPNRLIYFVHNGIHIPQIIYTIICLSVCQRSQTAGRNSCSIVSGNVSNCSHRLTVYPVTSSRLSSA